MGGIGAELDEGVAQPGCQHRQHPRTNGLARHHEPNATNGEKMIEQRESDITLRLAPCDRLAQPRDGGAKSCLLLFRE
jgi:hypothetical protein